MAADYSAAIATAVALLARFGAAGTVARMVDGGEANAATPWRVNAPDTEDLSSFAVTVVIVPKSGVNPATMVAYSAVAYMRPNDNVSVPTNEDRLTDAAGRVWKIKSVETLAPDATSNIIHTCELQQWPSP